MDPITEKIEKLRRHHSSIRRRSGRVWKKGCNRYGETPEEISKRMKGNKHGVGKRSKAFRRKRSEQMKQYWKKQEKK